MAQRSLTPEQHPYWEELLRERRVISPALPLPPLPSSPSPSREHLPPEARWFLEKVAPQLFRPSSTPASTSSQSSSQRTATGQTKERSTARSVTRSRTHTTTSSARSKTRPTTSTTRRPTTARPTPVPAPPSPPVAPPVMVIPPSSPLAAVPVTSPLPFPSSPEVIMTEPQPAELPMQFRPVHRERPSLTLPSVPELPSDEPPPPSWEEQWLRGFLSDPQNWRELLTYAEMFPERYERLMAMIARYYPRAFPEGDILFQREWYANRQRRINEQLTMYQIQYQRAWDRYQAEIAELQEKWETFTQSINNAVTPQDVIGVLYEAAGAGLPPDKYQLLTRMGKTKLLAILSQLPTPEMQKTLDILGRRGFFSPQELETFQGYLRGEHWARRSLASVAQMDVARLRSAIERAKNLRVNAAPLETQLEQLERLTTMMQDMPTNPELLNVISRQTTQIATELERLVREALRPIETSLQRLASFIYAQFGNRDQLRSWFRDTMRTLPQVLGRFSPQLTQSLLQSMGDIEKANDKAIADGLLMLADALTETIERLKTDFGDFPQVTALVSMVEPLVGELRRKAQDLHTLTQTLERVYDQVGEALAKDPLMGMSEAQWRRLAMQERNLQLRELGLRLQAELRKWGLGLQAERNEIAKARLRLAEQMFDWRQQQANLGRALQTLGLMLRLHIQRGDYNNALRTAGTLANILSDLGNLDKLENLGLLSPELAGAAKVLRQISEVQLNALLSELQNTQQKSQKGTQVSPDPRILQRVDELLNTLLLSLGLPPLLAPEGQPTSPPPTSPSGQEQMPRQGRQLPIPERRPAAPRPSTSPSPARPSYRDVLGGGLFTP
jgi:hypothetical protein